MPTVREIEAYLYEFAPKELAVEWDNVGHLLGDPEQEVRRVLVSLDITEAVAREARDGGCGLIVAHHPLMNCRWHPVQSIRRDDPQGRLFMALLSGGVSCICMHTNLDAAAGGVNDVLAATLGLSNVELLPGGDNICRMGTLPEPVPLREFVRQAAKALHCGGIRYADAGKTVYRVAVGGGACGEYADAALNAGCDTFLTADIKYHGFLDAVAAGLNLIDAGHFPTEDPVCAKLVALLRDGFPELSVRKSALHADVIRYAVDEEE